MSYFPPVYVRSISSHPHQHLVLLMLDSIKTNSSGFKQEKNYAKDFASLTEPPAVRAGTWVLDHSAQYNIQNSVLGGQYISLPSTPSVAHCNELTYTLNTACQRTLSSSLNRPSILSSNDHHQRLKDLLLATSDRWSSCHVPHALAAREAGTTSIQNFQLLRGRLALSQQVGRTL